MATSVKFLLNRPKSEKPTSILVRFHSTQTKTITLSTGEMIPPGYWSGQRVSHKYRKDYDRINKHLSEIESKLFDLWRDHKSASGADLSEMVRSIVKGRESMVEKKTVIEAVKKFIAQYETEKEKGTVKRYKVLLNKLESFNPNLSFEELDVNFYDAFKTWLYGNPNSVYSGYHLERDHGSDAYIVCADTDGNNGSVRGHYPIGLFDDVVFKYFVNLKTVCAWAEMRGYTVHPAYKDKKSWPIIKREYEPIALTQDELHAVENLTFKPTERHLDIARDYFVLECRTGQRISDLRRFQRADIVGNRWTFSQKKGSRLNQKKVSLPLVGYSAPALLILQKYNYELPKISEQKLNKHIKTICERAGLTMEIFIERWAGNKKVRIPGPKSSFISTHTGRKTFITIALQFMSPQMVMNITGIKSFNTLKHYSGDSEISLVEEGLRKIENEVVIMRKAN